MTGFSVSPHKILVQKARGGGFEGSFYLDERTAAMQLLWEHLVHAKDQPAALEKLRQDLASHLDHFHKQWIAPGDDGGPDED